MLILAVAGMVWLLWCFIKAKEGVKLAWYSEIKSGEGWIFKRFKSFVHVAKKNSGHWAEDFIYSAVFIGVASILFVGVTGMMIGLVASPIISLVLQLRRKFNPVQSTT